MDTIIAYHDGSLATTLRQLFPHIGLDAKQFVWYYFVFLLHYFFLSLFRFSLVFILTSYQTGFSEPCWVERLLVTNLYVPLFSLAELLRLVFPLPSLSSLKPRLVMSQSAEIWMGLSYKESKSQRR